MKPLGDVAGGALGIGSRSRFLAAKEMLSQFRDNPYLRGRAEQTLGGVLIADGLVGLENPLDGEKSRPGILGAMVFIIVGGIFLAFGIVGHHSRRDIQTPVTVQGQVVNVVVSRSNSESTCQIVASYNVDGKNYTLRSALGSDRYCAYQEGGQIGVDYEKNSPSQAQLADDGGLGTMSLIFMVSGGIVLLLGLFTLAIRLLSMIAGAWLFIIGTKRSKGATPVPIDTLIDDFRTAVTDIIMGRPTTKAVAAPAGATAPAGAPVADAPAVPAPAPVVAAPAGWYAAGPQTLRWWDGTKWTDSYHPIPPPVPPSQ